MTTDDLSERRERLWTPVIAPAIWALHFTACYVTAALWCGRFAGAALDLYTVVGLYTLVAAVPIVALFVLGFRRHQYQWPSRPHDDDTPEDRRHFMAFTTMLLAGLSLLAMLYGGFAVALLDGCS